jgi:hypothetical protein
VILDCEPPTKKTALGKWCRHVESDVGRGIGVCAEVSIDPNGIERVCYWAIENRPSRVASKPAVLVGYFEALKEIKTEISRNSGV